MTNNDITIARKDRSQFTMPRAAALLFAASALALALSAAPTPSGASADEAPCPAGNAGLKLPEGFCATIFADNVGAPRHLAVAADGTVYVNNSTRDGGAALLALKDMKREGHADVIQKFGPP